jgi:Lrp/AsnC family leucine-responsive transcriptional regulator
MIRQSDAIDRKILGGRPGTKAGSSNVDLAVRIHLSAPQCYRRVRSLEERA